MRVIEAATPRELADVCADEMVACFGAIRARVVEGDRIWHEVGVANDDAVAWMVALRVSPPDEPAVKLEVTLGASEDVAIVRQQLLDLVGVVRRQWLRLRQLEKEQVDARSDALTGLANRRALAEFLDGAWQTALHTGRPLSVMLVDLDHFKLVNDTEGHPAGDDVLRLAAASFQTHLRPGDRVYRWGGDEFLIVLPGCTAQAAETIAERLREAFACQGRARGTTMTIGIADLESMPPGETVSARLISAADDALLAAKRAGRNRTTLAPCWRETG